MKEMMNKFTLDAEVERKEQREFRKEQREFAKSVMGFINSYSDNSVKHYYSDIPMRCSYMVSKIKQLPLFVHTQCNYSVQ